MTSINGARVPNPDKPPVDLDEYDWYLSEWEDTPHCYSRGPDGEKRPYYQNLPEPQVKVVVDSGSCVQTFILVKRLP